MNIIIVFFVVLLVFMVWLAIDENEIHEYMENSSENQIEQTKDTK